MTYQNDNDNVLFKLVLVWVSTISGMTITQWAAVFAIIYTVLQIVVLVRDKFIRDGKDKE